MFYRPKYKRYEYVPRYHDAEKKELDQRFKFAQSEARRERALEATGDFDRKDSFTFRAQYGSRKEKRQSGLRLILILAVLMAIAYMVLSDLVPTEKSEAENNRPVEVHDVRN